MNKELSNKVRKIRQLRRNSRPIIYEYLAENINSSISYSNYVSEYLDKSISYSEYISEYLDKSISYSDYLDYYKF